MVRNVVFDIGNVLAGFCWQEFYKSFGYSEEVFGKLADATVRSTFWNEMDRGKLSDEQLLEGFQLTHVGVGAFHRKRNTGGVCRYTEHDFAL